MSTIRQLLANAAAGRNEFLAATSGHGSHMRLEDGWEASDGVPLSDAWRAVAHWESHADTIGGAGIAVHKGTMMAVDEHALLSLGPGRSADAFGYVGMLDGGPFFRVSQPPRIASLAMDLTPLLGLADRAWQRRIDLTKMHAHAAARKPFGDDQRYREMLGDEYRVVFTIEEHPMGWCRHLSMSSVQPVYADAQRGWAYDIHEQPVSVAMAVLGFSCPFREALRGRAAVYSEVNPEFFAINVIQPIL